MQNKSTLSKLPLAVALAGLLAGCASIPKDDQALPSVEKQEAHLLQNKDWHLAPFRQAYGAPVVLITPTEIPKALREKELSLKLNDNANLSALASALGEMHIPVLVQTAKVGSIPLTVPYFQGTLGALLKAVSSLKDVFFVWDGSALLLEKEASFSATIPQTPRLAKTVQSALGTLGATKITYSRQTGNVNFKADPSAIRRIKPYLASLNSNSALVSLRVAVISVQLSSAHDSGVDWGALEAAVSPGLLTGALSSLTSGIPAGGGGPFSSPTTQTTPSSSSPTGSNGTSTSTSTSTSNGTGTIGTATGTETSSGPNGTTLALSGSGLQLTVSNPSFSFSGVLQFLDTYGKTSTLQNVLVRTLSGSKVKLENNTQIPYVSNVGIGAVGSSGGAATSVGTASTSTANSGITLNLMPYYNYRTGQVTVSIKVELNAVLGFNQLSAGSQLGSFTQPTTQTEELTSLVKVLPGQPVILGGLRYRTIADNRQGLPWLATHGLASKDLQLSDQEMIIVLRPTVTVYNKQIPANLNAEPIYQDGHAELYLKEHKDS